MSLEQLATLLLDDDDDDDNDARNEAAGRPTAAAAKADGKKYTRVLLPLCALGFIVQAVGATLAGQAESDAVQQRGQQDEQTTTTTTSTTTTTGLESRYAISTGDMVVIIGLVLQLNALCIAGYRLLVVIWRQQGTSFRPPAAVMRDGLLELENASSGWRRRLLAQSQRGGGGQTEMATSHGQSRMPDMPPPAAAAAGAGQRDFTQTAPSETLGGGHRQAPPPPPPLPRLMTQTSPRGHRKSSRLGPNMFSTALVASTILILARTAYRVVEFAQPSLRHGGASAADGETLFAMFDGFFVALATLLLLVVAHPLLTLSGAGEKHHLQRRTREERVNAWYLGAAGARERHRRIQDWVEGIALGGGQGGEDSGEGGEGGGGGGGGRRLSRRLSWVSRRTGWTGRSGGTGAGAGGGSSTLRRYREEEEVGDDVVEPGRARIMTYR